MNKIFILSGASGSGKTTLLNQLIQADVCAAAIKYSERQRFSEVDDITMVRNINDSKLECDLIYTMYGNRYGFSSSQLKNQLQKGSVVLISNDKETIQKIRDIFPKQVIAIYVVSDINRRFLRNIYMKRHGFPSLEKIKGVLISYVKMAESMIWQDEGGKLVQYLDLINHIIDELFLEDEEFKLRLDSIKNQEDINLQLYDYTVLNLYSNSMSTIHATKSAFEHLKMIISKEMEEKYE